MRLYTPDREPLDFCRNCAPDPDAIDEYGGDLCDYDADHPPYEDGEKCCDCGEELTDDD